MSRANKSGEIKIIENPFKAHLKSRNSLLIVHLVSIFFSVTFVFLTTH